MPRTSKALLISLILVTSVSLAEDSALVRLLKSGKVPPERQTVLIDQLGKRGNPEDLAYLLGRALQADGFVPAARKKAFDALLEAVQTRKVMPATGVDRIVETLAPEAKVDPAVRMVTISLAGLWKVEKSAPALARIAAEPKTSIATRAAVFKSLAELHQTATIASLTDPKYPVEVRLPAVAALVELGEDSATGQAVALLGDMKPGIPPTPLIAAFLDRQDGGAKLAKAVAGAKLSPDAAKLALRSVYELGRTDAALVTELTKAAGLSNEVKPPTPAEIEKLIAEVQTHGDAARGEQVFRRPDVNCMKCHALAGAGGGVGPELSPIGQTSPVDYLIYSILVPDQSIKEEFQTKVFLTTDGRVLQGIVVDKDEKRIILKEATGELRTIATDDIEESKDGGSLMPKGLTNFMTRAEMVDLLRFLSELGKPGPYAIRPVPTVQRWRVLKAPAEILVQSVPDADVLASQVLGTEPSHWFPAYGMVNGELGLKELVAQAGSPVLYLQGEIDVSGEGSISFHFDSPDGVTAWLDEHPLAVSKSTTVPITVGKKKLTIRVDTEKRSQRGLRVEVARGAGPSAEFRVVGGR